MQILRSRTVTPSYGEMAAVVPQKVILLPFPLQLQFIDQPVNKWQRAAVKERTWESNGVPSY